MKIITQRRILITQKVLTIWEAFDCNKSGGWSPRKRVLQEGQPCSSKALVQPAVYGIYYIYGPSGEEG